MKNKQVLVVRADNVQLDDEDKLRTGDLKFSSEVKDLNSLNASDRDFLLKSLKVCAEELPQTPWQRFASLFRSRRLSTKRVRHLS